MHKEKIFVPVKATASMRRVDIATSLYLISVAALAFFFGEKLEGRGILITLYLVLAGFILLFHRLRGKSLPPSISFLLSWYPVATFSLFYKQVEALAAVIGDWGMTEVVQHWEIVLFNGYPGVWLSEYLPSAIFSEYLHFCYLCYALFIPAVGGYWYFRGRRMAFRELLFLLSITYYSSFLFYILFPVDSPYYLFPPLKEPAAGNFFYSLVHFVSDRAGARGGAFPSSHVSASTVVLLTVWRHQPKLGCFLLPIVTGIFFSTIYGRFHYALDAFAGLLLGGLVFLLFHSRDSAVKKGNSA